MEWKYFIGLSLVFLTVFSLILYIGLNNKKDLELKYSQINECEDALNFLLDCRDSFFLDCDKFLLDLLTIRVNELEKLENTTN